MDKSWDCRIVGSAVKGSSVCRFNDFPISRFPDQTIPQSTPQYPSPPAQAFFFIFMIAVAAIAVVTVAIASVTSIASVALIRLHTVHNGVYFSHASFAVQVIDIVNRLFVRIILTDDHHI